MQAQQRSLRPKWNVPMPSRSDRERGAREIRREDREDCYENRRRKVRTRLFDPGRAGVVLAAGAGTIGLFRRITRGSRRGIRSILTRCFRFGVTVACRNGIVRRGRRYDEGSPTMTTCLTTQPRPETAAAERNRHRQEEADEGPEWAATVEHGRRHYIRQVAPGCADARRCLREGCSARQLGGLGHFSCERGPVSRVNRRL